MALLHAGRRLLGAAAFLAVALTPLSGWGADEVNPHRFMGDIYKCTECHVTVPIPGKDDFRQLEFTNDIVSICERCHRDKINEDKHPVDIKPERPVPQDLHLDSYYSITCTTCHDPHAEPWDDMPYVSRSWIERLLDAVRGRERHRTFLLRKTNVEGELCLSCHTRRGLREGEEVPLPPGESQYVGSPRCNECHPAIYQEWRKTLHARFALDPKKETSALKAVFTGDKPFPPDSVLFTLGQHWTQRFVVAGKDGEPMVRPEIWSLGSGKWLDSGTFSRSWKRYCIGCHTTGFEPVRGTYAEPGIGCEACHGPGGEHCQSTDPFDIVNPSKLDPVRRDMVCEACHTSGHDRSGLYRFPVGYRPGEDLMKYFRGLVPKPGQETDTYLGDNTYEDRHRQFLFWISRYNIASGITCDVCKNFRQSQFGGEELTLTSSELCATCHQWHWRNYRAHSRHAPDDAGCIDCHAPAVVRGGKAYSIHDHRFQFAAPVAAENVSLEGSCRRCHGTGVSVAALGARRAP
jgi:hypothetical protein